MLSGNIQGLSFNVIEKKQDGGWHAKKQGRMHGDQFGKGVMWPKQQQIGDSHILGKCVLNFLFLDACQGPC